MSSYTKHDFALERNVVVHVGACRCKRLQYRCGNGPIANIFVEPRCTGRTIANDVRGHSYLRPLADVLKYSGDYIADMPAIVTWTQVDKSFKDHTLLTRVGRKTVYTTI